MSLIYLCHTSMLSDSGNGSRDSVFSPHTLSPLTYLGIREFALYSFALIHYGHLPIVVNPALAAQYVVNTCGHLVPFIMFISPEA